MLPGGLTQQAGVGRCRSKQRERCDGTPESFFHSVMLRLHGLFGSVLRARPVHCVISRLLKSIQTDIRGAHFEM